MSAFDLNIQNKNIDSKIVVALERISEAFRVLLWNESRENALSPIQIQILIFLLYQDDSKCKVSYLAQEFNMTKATISDSVKILLQKGFIKKQEDADDSRSYTIHLTITGKKVALHSAQFSNALELPITRLSNDQKEVMLTSLLNIIYDLNRNGIITIQRMCFTCVNYKKDVKGHYCNLLQTKLTNTDLRIDCPEHEYINN